MSDMTGPNQESRAAWDANAGVWDARMGDVGNDFFNLLQWPVIASFLDPRPADRILDAACGNGLTSRKLAGLGASVMAFDFSAELIKLAQSRQNPDARITYHTLDATDESALLKTLSPHAPFDSALCNMALFDMAEIGPFFRALRNLLKPGGVFVFSLTERPLQYYLNTGFENGFVLDGFAERAFPLGYPTSHPLSWGGQFSEIPPVLVARMRLSNQ